jgi:hypothetical protein
VRSLDIECWRGRYSDPISAVENERAPFDSLGDPRLPADHLSMISTTGRIVHGRAILLIEMVEGQSVRQRRGSETVGADETQCRRHRQHTRRASVNAGAKMTFRAGLRAHHENVRAGSAGPLLWGLYIQSPCAFEL